MGSLVRKALLLALVQLATAQEPVRVAVISRFAEALGQASRTFEVRYGKDLIELKALDDNLRCADLEGVRAVFVHGGFWSQAMLACAGTVKRIAESGGAFGGTMAPLIEANWRVKADRRLARAQHYLSNGGENNLVAFLALLYRAGGGQKALAIAEPEAGIESGIYHPKSPAVHVTRESYLAWYRGSGLIPEGAPLVGITFFPTIYNYSDMAPIDALIEALETRGIGAVAAFGWPLRAVEPLLITDGKPVVDVLLCLNLLMANPDNTRFLEQYGLHAINLTTTTASYKEWAASGAGLPPGRLPIQIGTAERTGATEPILVATTEQQRLVPVRERIEAAAARAARWIALRRKPNHEKRVALIYYNNPPGKASLGASYLNLLPSLSNILSRLSREGYVVDTRVPDEDRLKRLLMLSGRNVGEYAPGELEALLKDGHATLLPLAKYEEWYRELPEGFRAFTEKTWGAPAQSKLMTVRAGEKMYFIIPGIRLGNMFLGPQPLRGELASAPGRTHDQASPVPHSYIACYLWYRRQFQADAVVHMGRHGTLEWLPGKDVAQAGSDTGEVLMGDLPHPYYYVVDGGGEYLQSKRRSSAVMISHLTPLLVSAGVPADLQRLKGAIENRQRALDSNQALAREYETEILAEARRLNLDRQLGISCTKENVSEVIEKLEEFIHDVESQPIPLGLHTIGALPEKATLADALAQFIESAFRGQEASEARLLAPKWAAELVEGSGPQCAPALFQKIEREARLWLANVESSAERELESLVDVLSGKFLPTGVSGDPLRSPEAVPTGRNLHDQDPRGFPTRSAWEVGKRMGQSLVEEFRKRAGKYPEKIAFVLWYGESNRHQGIAEAQALYLLGVEPVWNGRGHVDDVQLIPSQVLGRPRVDVVLTMSGLYRDGMPEKVRLLDKAAQLAAGAEEDNPIRRNTQRVEATLLAQGVDAATAKSAAGARVFGPAPGVFGAGLAEMMRASRDEGDSSKAAELYLRNMGYAYTDGLWGQQVGGTLRAQLSNNRAVIHSRSTNLYGVLDNDETYQFAGGLSAATKLASGQAPELYISNVRRSGEERFEDMKRFLTRELSSRLLNPKWIEGMKSSGYAGAQEMAKEIEHLYGLRATAPDSVDTSVWQQAFNVYVADRHGLGLDDFLSKENPHAQQMLAARLLEIDRQGVHRFSESDRRELVRALVESTNLHGVSCYVNACDNRRLRAYVAKSALGAVPVSSLREWQSRMKASEARSVSRTSHRAVRASVSVPPRPLFDSVHHVEIVDGKLHVGEYQIGLEWLLFAAASFSVGCVFSLYRRFCRASGLELGLGSADQHFRL